MHPRGSIALAAIALGASLAGASARARAEPIADVNGRHDVGGVREVRAAVTVRSDQGTHPVRLELGARRGRAELALVVDPMAARDGQTDLDLVATRWSGDAGSIGLFTGWRTSAYSVLGGAVWHQKLLVGVLGRLGALAGDRVRLVGGIELCAEVVRHGDMIATEWFDARSPRHVGDLVNFSLFARAELAFGY